MRLLSSAFLFLVLIGIHILFGHTHLSTVHTYVPPLTHSPGMGLSIVGTHNEPPFMLLDLLHNNAQPEVNRSIQDLFVQYKYHLDTGVRLRLQMQTQTLQLLDLLPANSAHSAWKNRSIHEKSIGEVHIWDELLAR